MNGTEGSITVGFGGPLPAPLFGRIRHATGLDSICGGKDVSSFGGCSHTVRGRSHVRAGCDRTRCRWAAQSLVGSLAGSLAERWAADAEPQSVRLSAGISGAAIAAQGQARPGGYRYYQQGCYQQRGDGAWIAVAPRYCATAAAAPVEVTPPPAPPRVVRDELRERMLLLRESCEDGDRRACVRLGIIIGENRERRAAWRRENPEVFFFER
jgi:hypothetical protein